MKKTIGEKMTHQCEKLADELGFELIEVGIEKEQTGNYLRIYLDKVGGITLDDCEVYHRRIQPLMEKVEYDFLEVSSPGIDRPLKKERDFLRHLGTQIEVRFYKSIDGKKSIVATLVEYKKDEIIVETAMGLKSFLLKNIALAKPFIDLEGIEEVVL